MNRSNRTSSSPSVSPPFVQPWVCAGCWATCFHGLISFVSHLVRGDLRHPHLRQKGHGELTQSRSPTERWRSDLNPPASLTTSQGFPALTHGPLAVCEVT